MKSSHSSQDGVVLWAWELVHSKYRELSPDWDLMCALQCIAWSEDEVMWNDMTSIFTLGTRAHKLQRKKKNKQTPKIFPTELINTTGVTL